MLKSPFNYIGGKYRLLQQLLPLFPVKINTFVDLFTGGLDVSLNVRAASTHCNDINHYLISVYTDFQRCPLEQLLADIGGRIAHYRLSKTNEEGFLQLRADYNATHDPLLLFLLTCYGFNHQLRFNSRGEFNNPFGRNRSEYNANIQANLIRMHRRIKAFQFTALNFKDFDVSHLRTGDFLYADPPYLISCGSYNDGKRGFEGWSEADDQQLFELLDGLNARNVQFALSNVVSHKGQVNRGLIEWAGKYNTHHINYRYNNSSYHQKDRQPDTDEVLITNYKNYGLQNLWLDSEPIVV